MCSLLLATTTQGQTALRSSLAGDQAAERRKRALQDQPYNLEWGPGRYLFSAALSLEFTDNPRLTSVDPEGDFILRPTLGVFSVFPFSERNAVRFDLAVGYQKYIKNPEYDALTIRPGSELGVDLYLQDVTLNLHNRVRYTTDPLEQGAVSNTGEYGGLTDTLGASVTWDRNQLIVSGGYDHSWFAASSDRYEYLSRHGDSLYLRGTFLFHDALTAGLESAAGWNRYEEPILNNSLNTSLGAFVEWQPTTLLGVELRGGNTRYLFEETGLVGPTPDTSGFYLQADVNHQLNPWLSHSISGGRSFDLGVNADLQELWRVRYNLRWRVRENFSLNTGLYFEDGKEDGAQIAEDYQRVGFSAGTSYRLMRSLALGLNYSFTLKDSAFAGRDYRQNRVTLTATYVF